MEFENQTLRGYSASGTKDFVSIGLEKLEELDQEFGDLDDILLDIKSLDDGSHCKQVDRLTADLASFEPSITMVGQIKAGKTSLVNAMIGRPGFLPADVNPWTSVVTSLHLNSAQDPDAPKASFQLFDRTEWNHLIQNGGRIGELSMRAGAEDELQKIHGQIQEMFTKTQERLGKKFELLLGQKHEYSELEDNLIQRYVCMGDDFEQMSQVEQQGQLADITKSADLYIDVPAIPHALCIRDTPGVNDTFMVREQITIQSLRKSKLCVVVLSASQALSSIDLGLIRLVSNIKSRKIVIFVNRIDELSDPISQLPGVRDSIVETLEKHNGPKDVEIVFGSAYWANLLLSDTMDEIQEDSAKALEKCVQHVVGESSTDQISDKLIWQLSGIPHLFAALSNRIAEGEGHHTLLAVRRRAQNLMSGLMASNKMMSLRLEGSSVEVLGVDIVQERLQQIENNLKQKLEAALDEVFVNFTSRINQSHDRFLGRALESLLQHLEKHGEDEIWQYSPDGLRILMRSGYQSMRVKFTAACNAAFEEAANDMTNLYRDTLSAEVENFAIEPPMPPEVPAPVSVGQTIALDLQTSWWKGWWQRRKGYKSLASGFHDLIEAETSPIVDDLKNRQADEIRELASKRLEDFLSEQSAILMDVAEKARIHVDDLNSLFGITAQKELMAVMQEIFEELSIDSDEEDGSAENKEGGVAA